MLRLIFSVFLLLGCSVSVFSVSSVFCKRTFSTYQVTEGGEIEVTVEINKGDAVGIAKLVEDIPSGLHAYEYESIGGVFTFEQQKLKIVWLTIPLQQVFKVKYKLKPVGQLMKDYHLVGRFLYVVGDNRLEVILSDAILFGKAEAAAVTAVATDHAKDMASKLDTMQNVIYKIQLGAFSVKKEDAVFNGLTGISVETGAGVYRYFTGSFALKSEALVRLQEAKEKGFPTAYIVPFVNGKRLN